MTSTASGDNVQELPDPEAFVEALAPALREAASIARSMEGRVANRPKRGETSAVKAALTVADTASQEAILVPLLARFPQVCIAAEEDTPTARRFPDSIFPSARQTMGGLCPALQYVSRFFAGSNTA